ncbi:MAG TPA: hypothetical protein VIT42_12400 [Microlunatus sp.]
MTILDQQHEATPTLDAPGARYAATLRRSSGDQQYALGATKAELRTRYAALWPAGWRLLHLRGHSVADGARYTAIWKRSLRSEITVYGVSLDELTERYRRIWSNGWRLKLLNAHPVVLESGPSIGYTAAWEPSRTPEHQLYSAPHDEFETRQRDLINQGWRLSSLTVHTDNGIDLPTGEPRYTAIWQPSVVPEIIRCGMSEVVFQAEYERLWVQGWRLKLLAPYVERGHRRFTAVWVRSPSPEIQLPTATVSEVEDRYRTLWQQGWRLKSLEPHGHSV